MHSKMSYLGKIDKLLRPTHQSSLMDEQQDGLPHALSITSSATTTNSDAARRTITTTTITTNTITMAPKPVLQRSGSKSSTQPPLHTIKQFPATDSEIAEQNDRIRKNEAADKCAAVLEAQNHLQALDMNNTMKGSDFNDEKFQKELNDLIREINTPIIKDKERASFREALFHWEEEKLIPTKNFHMLRAATDPSNPCLPALGMCFLYGIGPFSDESIGYKILYVCYHKLGIRECGVLLGRYEDSRRNYEIARKYYQEGAKHGCTYAQNELALYYIKGICGELNKKTGFNLLLTAASKPVNNVAKYNLANAYFLGDGVAPCMKQYWYWLNQAAENGNVESQFVLGQHYETGELGQHHEPGEKVDVILKKDLPTALEWYRQSATGGHLSAVFYLIRYYEKKNDERELIYWYTIAAELGNTESQFRLGGYYEFGQNKIVEKNTRIALEWYFRCIANNYIPAFVCVGRCYEKMGNIQESIHWYQQASLAGCSEANTHYTRLMIMTKK